MAKKPEVNKTQAVRDYLKANHKAKNQQVVDALAKKGITITASYVANIKAKHNKTRIAKKAAKKPAPAAVEKKPVDTITLDQIRKVAQAMKTIGGYQRVTEVLEVIRELGGVKKFKDLAEAMTATEMDCIPF